MSPSIIVALAFLATFIFSYRALKKTIKNTLNKKRNNSKLINKEIEKFKKDVLEHYKKSSEKYTQLDEEINKIMNEVLNKANRIIKYNRQQLDQTLNENAHFHFKKVTNHVEKAIDNLQANTVNIAANAVKKAMQMHQNNNNSKIISTLSRNLNKKLH
ncbi:MAG: hypothetical protein K0T53_00225 [Wolbachia pipientis]|nr:hypothetical protein [Wolbachia pipientis]